jgi:hypothetical protein
MFLKISQLNGPLQNLQIATLYTLPDWVWLGVTGCSQLSNLEKREKKKENVAN